MSSLGDPRLWPRWGGGQAAGHPVGIAPRFCESLEPGASSAHKRARKGRKGAKSFRCPPWATDLTHPLISASQNSTIIVPCSWGKLSLGAMTRPVCGRSCYVAESAF